ncbi:MAG: roadblock/LC7 domain-containing protein [Dermatophilaceae bacterium]
MSRTDDRMNLDWLMSDFVDRVPGVAHAVGVSADGLLLAMSDRLPRDRADQLAAIACGLASLTVGASRALEGGSVNQILVDLEHGFLVVMSISGGSCLAVLAARTCDIGQVGFEMGMVADRVGVALTPQPRTSPDGASR